MPRKVLANNSSDEDLLYGKSGQDLRVPVLNMRGKPPMPTTSGNVRVVQRSPFTIQLNYPTGEAKQNITLGIDAGYSAIGFSAVTDKKELICGELTLRKRISKLLEQRRTYRRTRRAKLWHRKPRFNNRSRPNGWLAPSIQHKFDTHLRLIEKLKKILPVKK